MHFDPNQYSRDYIYICSVLQNQLSTFISLFSTDTCKGVFDNKSWRFIFSGCPFLCVPPIKSFRQSYNPYKTTKIRCGVACVTYEYNLSNLRVYFSYINLKSFPLWFHGTLVSM